MPKKRDLLTVDDVSGAWAIMPTPAKAGAESWEKRDTVDLDEAARVVDALVHGGIDGILSLGTFGECATLLWDEKRAFMATVVEAAQGRVPVFVGSTTLNTRETIEHTRFASDLGADGTMLGIPMWCAPSVETAVRFYRDVAEACPDMAMAVYANPEAFKFDFPPAFWAQVASIPQIVTAKTVGLGGLLRNIEVTERRIRFLPIDFDYYGAARMMPEFCSAFWTSGAVCGPRVVTELRDEVRRATDRGDWGRAKRISDAMGKTVATLFPHGSFKEFSMYNIGLEKVRMDAAGWMKAGPIRPPYHVLPEEYAEGARTSGRMWADLERALLSGEFDGETAEVREASP